MFEDENTPPEGGQDTGEQATGGEGGGQNAADSLFDDAPAGEQAPGAPTQQDAMNDEDEQGKSRVEELDAVYDVPVQISAVLGRATMPVNHLLKLGRGAIVQLDKRVGEAIEIFVNNKLVARGEVVVVEERLGITMTEIIKSDRQT